MFEFEPEFEDTHILTERSLMRKRRRKLNFIIKCQAKCTEGKFNAYNYMVGEIGGPTITKGYNYAN